jgi:uncharacterized flavoprotein (TIGR03862 family)
LLNTYTGPKEFLEKIFANFPVEDWLKFINALGVKTLLGTSHRYFVEGLKSTNLIQQWIKQLSDLGVNFAYKKELIDFQSINNEVELTFSDGTREIVDAACLCLGGASWKALNPTLPAWINLLRSKGIDCVDFEAANAGFEVSWTETFLKEAEGQPLKNIAITSSQGIYPCELMVTSYGLEGSPIYRINKPETICLDLKPDLSVNDIEKKLNQGTENLSPMRRTKKYLNLCPASLALIFHHAPDTAKATTKTLAAIIKKIPITLTKKRGLDEAISSSGGISWSALNDNLMIKDHPRVFVAGEMMAWSAPTGGFLIYACAALGKWAGEKVTCSLS